MQEVLIDNTDGVMTITLNRVEKKNSFTSAMYSACADALDAAKADASVRVVVFQGHATVFSAGYDIADFLNRRRQPVGFVRRLGHGCLSCGRGTMTANVAGINARACDVCHTMRTCDSRRLRDEVALQMAC